MTAISTQNSKPAGFPAATIIKAGLIAGTLDICLAFGYSYIKRGTAPGKVLQYIANMVFGKQAFTNPVVAGIAGLLVHFAIAMGWTILFFMLYNKLKLYKVNKVFCGIVYGLIVWALMNTTLLPLWNSKPYVFNAEGALINAAILIVAIGMPLSFIAQGHQLKNNS